LLAICPITSQVGVSGPFGLLISQVACLGQTWELKCGTTTRKIMMLEWGFSHKISHMVAIFTLDVFYVFAEYCITYNPSI
jgi:hypothetical protein